MARSAGEGPDELDLEELDEELEDEFDEELEDEPDREGESSPGCWSTGSWENTFLWPGLLERVLFSRGFLASPYSSSSSTRRPPRTSNHSSIHF